MWRWKIKQDAIDETDRINLENLRLEQLSKDEIQEKAEEEVKEEIDDLDNEKEVTENPKFKINYEALSKHLMELESQFYNKILEYNTFEYEPVSNVKIDDTYQADILLRSYGVKKKIDVLIEIKYLQKGLSMSLVINTHDRLKKSYGHYMLKPKDTLGRFLLLYIKVHQQLKIKSIASFVQLKIIRNKQGQGFNYLS